MGDLDGGGTIESSELMQLGQARRVLGQKDDEWTEEKNAALVKKLDTDGDGRVSCVEFVEHFERGMPKAQDEFYALLDEFVTAARECRERKLKQEQAATKEKMSAAAAETDTGGGEDAVTAASAEEDAVIAADEDM